MKNTPEHPYKNFMLFTLGAQFITWILFLIWDLLFDELDLFPDVFGTVVFYAIPIIPVVLYFVFDKHFKTDRPVVTAILQHLIWFAIAFIGGMLSFLALDSEFMLIEQNSRMLNGVEYIIFAAFLGIAFLLTLIVRLVKFLNARHASRSAA